TRLGRQACIRTNEYRGSAHLSARRHSRPTAPVRGWSALSHNHAVELHFRTVFFINLLTAKLGYFLLHCSWKTATKVFPKVFATNPFLFPEPLILWSCVLAPD